MVAIVQGGWTGSLDSLLWYQVEEHEVRLLRRAELSSTLKNWWELIDKKTQMFSWQHTLQLHIPNHCLLRVIHWLAPRFGWRGDFLETMGACLVSLRQPEKLKLRTFHIPNLFTVWRYVKNVYGNLLGFSMESLRYGKLLLDSLMLQCSEHGPCTTPGSPQLHRATQEATETNIKGTMSH